jgi:hypothetical protein
MKMMSIRLVETVVVGRATVLASNKVPHESVRAAVPVIARWNVCASVGVPVQFVDMFVTFTARAEI